MLMISALPHRSFSVCSHVVFNDWEMKPQEARIQNGKLLNYSKKEKPKSSASPTKKTELKKKHNDSCSGAASGLQRLARHQFGAWGVEHLFGGAPPHFLMSLQTFLICSNMFEHVLYVVLGSRRGLFSIPICFKWLVIGCVMVCYMFCKVLIFHFLGGIEKLTMFFSNGSTNHQPLLFVIVVSSSLENGEVGACPFSKAKNDFAPKADGAKMLVAVMRQHLRLVDRRSCWIFSWV